MKTLCLECERKKNFLLRQDPEWSEKRRAATKLRYQLKREFLLGRDSTIRATPTGRARQLITHAKMRSKAKGLDFSLDIDQIIEVLKKGKCEVTGIPFDFEPHPEFFYNPFAPSLDKIDPKKGYTHDNVQIVIWAYNAGKSQMNDEYYRGLIVYMASVFLSGGPNAA